MSVSKRLLIDEERALQERIEDLFPGLLGTFPLEPYVSKLQKKDSLLQYEIFSSSIIKKLDLIKVEHGQSALAHYHKISLCRFMRDTLTRLDRDPLPAAIRQAYGLWFDRVTEDFHTQPDSYYDIDRPLWPLRKDIGICSGRSTPIGGAWVIERRLLAHRAMITRARRRRATGNHEEIQGPTAFGKTLAVVLQPLRIYPAAQHVIRATRRSLGKHDMCYVIHTIERNIQGFNAEQMELAYRNLASLLERDTNVWGIYRSSWFLDPAVADISPNMAFLMQVPLDNGAELYDNGPCSRNDILKATLLSSERSRLHASGDYLPRNYFYFWPRARIIEAFGNDHKPQRPVT